MFRNHEFTECLFLAGQGLWSFYGASFWGVGVNECGRFGEPSGLLKTAKDWSWESLHVRWQREVHSPGAVGEGRGEESLHEIEEREPRTLSSGSSPGGFSS